MKDFMVADGSVIGRCHLERHIPNQDALYTYQDADKIIAVVCDGCGSSKYSEIGARLCSRWIVEGLQKNHWAITDGLAAAKYLHIVRDRVCTFIKTVAYLFEGRYTDVVGDYFLFTSVIAFVGKHRTFVASIGDGYFALNGVVQQIGPYENNAPPYIAYNLVKDNVSMDSESFDFKVHAESETRYINSLMIGTDGLEDLIASENRNCPGKKHEKVGPLSQFWTDDKYFKNPVAIDRKLNVINKNSCKLTGRFHLKKEPGILRDDTSLVVIKRKEDDNISEGEEASTKSS